LLVVTFATAVLCRVDGRRPLRRVTYPSTVAMLPKMLEDDRRRAGWSVGQAEWRLGASIREKPGA
jgi:hypothetical protein